MSSLVSQITATIIVSVVWFAFIVLYLAFYAGGLDFWQKAAVFSASMALAGGAIAVLWVRWTVRST